VNFGYNIGKEVKTCTVKNKKPSNSDEFDG